MGASYFTICDEVTLSAAESGRFNGREVGPNVEVGFPDREWDQTVYLKPYPTVEAAKDAAKSLAETLKSHKPKGITGFYVGARKNLANPALVAAREAIETAVREWAGEDALIASVN